MTKHLPSSRAKRITIQSLLAVSVVGLGVAGVMTQIDQGNSVEAAQAETQVKPTGLDMATYGNVETLRRVGGLASEDLAALGMDEAEAGAVLNRLADWCQANEKMLSESQQAVQHAKNDLREEQRLARTGQATQRDLADGNKKIKTLYEAQKARDELTQTGSAYAMEAAPGKSAAWQKANELKGATSIDMRYLTGLNDQRIKNLKSEADRKGVSIEKAMSRSELRELSEVRYRIRTKMAGVQAAEEATLPLPEELRLIEEDLEFEDLLLEEK